MRSPAQWCVAFVGLVFVVGAAALSIAAGSSFTTPIDAQGALGQLGLTEASARSLLFDEMKSERGGHRRGAIEVAGHRAFYKLPPAARGSAATALFAWAKAYVNSPAFKTAYAQFRKGAMPLPDERPGPSAEAPSGRDESQPGDGAPDCRENASCRAREISGADEGAGEANGRDTRARPENHRGR